MADTALSIAQRIRSFLHELFASRYSGELEREIEDLKRERDYFRGRAERLELRLMPSQSPAVIPSNFRPVGRKTFAQVQEEHARKLQEEANQEKEN